MHSNLRHDTPAFSPNSNLRMQLNPNATEFSAQPKGDPSQSQTETVNGTPTQGGLNPLSNPFNPGPTSPMNLGGTAPQPPPHVPPQPDFSYAANFVQAPMQPTLIMQPQVQVQPPMQPPMMMGMPQMQMQHPMPPQIPPQMAPQAMPMQQQQQQMMPPMAAAEEAQGGFGEMYDLYSEYAAYEESAQMGAPNESGRGGPVQQAPPQQRPQTAVQRPHPPIPPRPQPPGSNSPNGKRADDDLQNTIKWQKEQISELQSVVEERNDEIQVLRQEKSRVATRFDELRKQYENLFREHQGQKRRHQDEVLRLRRRLEQQSWDHYDNQYVESPERRQVENHHSNGNAYPDANGFAAGYDQHRMFSPSKSLRGQSTSPSRVQNGTETNIVTAIKSFRATQPDEIDLTAFEEYFPVKNQMGGGSMVEVKSKTGHRGWVPASHLTPI